MIESLQILFQYLFVLLIFLFPFNLINFQFIEGKFNFFDKINLNILIQLNFYFIFSFLNFKFFKLPTIEN